MSMSSAFQMVFGQSGMLLPMSFFCLIGIAVDEDACLRAVARPRRRFIWRRDTAPMASPPDKTKPLLWNFCSAVGAASVATTPLKHLLPVAALASGLETG